MFKIRNTQLLTLELPVLKKIKVQAINSLRSDYPETIQDITDKELQLKFRFLIEEAKTLNFSLEDSIYTYLILCIRYKTNQIKLMKNEKVKSIINNSGFFETEKLFLVEEILGGNEYK
jgi:hypothetical protein